MDFMLEFKPTAGKYAMLCSKLKDGAAWKPQTFDLVAMGDSARVWWDEPGEMPNGTGKQGMTLLATFQQHPSSKFTAKQLSEVIGAGQTSTINALTRLVDKNQVKRTLLDEGKQASNRNPWVYSLVLPD
jgi:response regulator of citrate/malate metabolism